MIVVRMPSRDGTNRPARLLNGIGHNMMVLVCVAGGGGNGSWWPHQQLIRRHDCGAHLSLTHANVSFAKMRDEEYVIKSPWTPFIPIQHPAIIDCAAAA